MARTNCIVTVTSRNKAYNGTQGNTTGNNYAAWINEAVNAETVSSVFGGAIDFMDRARGFGIIFEDVNFVNAFLTYNNNNYEFLKYAKFFDYHGNTHHVEFIYG